MTRALLQGHLGKAKQLLANGADVNENSGAPLLAAVSTGNDSAVEYLISAGANVNLGDRTALLTAIIGRHFEILRQLIEAGADVNANDGELLLVAMLRPDPRVIIPLLDAGADARRRDGQILLAAIRGAPDEILSRLLREAGNCGRKRLDCLHLACQKRDSPRLVARVLEQTRPRLSENDVQALMRTAVGYCNDEAVETLSVYGACISVVEAAPSWLDIQRDEGFRL